MFNIGPAELLVIGVLALLVLGPTKLPEAARQAGRVMAEVRKVSTGFQSELRGALHEPVDRSPDPKGKSSHDESDGASDGASDDDTVVEAEVDVAPAGAHEEREPISS